MGVEGAATTGVGAGNPFPPPSNNISNIFPMVVIELGLPWICTIGNRLLQKLKFKYQL